MRGPKHTSRARHPAFRGSDIPDARPRLSALAHAQMESGIRRPKCSLNRAENSAVLPWRFVGIRQSRRSARGNAAKHLPANANG